MMSSNQEKGVPDKRLVLILTLVFAALSLVLMYWRGGMGMWFIGSALVWATFFFVYLRSIITVVRYALHLSMVLLAVNVVLAVTVLPHKTASTTNGSSRKLVACTSKSDTPLEKVAGWDTSLFPAEWATENTPQPSEVSAQKASYSFAAIGKKQVANIFYYIKKSDGSYLSTDTKRIIEICDNNNQTYQYWTTGTTKTTGAMEGVVASESYMQAYGINEKSVPGTFRVDAYLFSNGAWHLTDRIDSVSIVK